MASLAAPGGWRHEAARAAHWRVYGQGPNVDGHDAEEQKEMDWDSPHASLRCMKGWKETTAVTLQECQGFFCWRGPSGRRR